MHLSCLSGLKGVTMDFTAVLAQIKPKLGCVADNLATIEEQ